jgi:hypothetical protein
MFRLRKSAAAKSAAYSICGQGEKQKLMLLYTNSFHRLSAIIGYDMIRLGALSSEIASLLVYTILQKCD